MPFRRSDVPFSEPPVLHQARLEQWLADSLCGLHEQRRPRIIRGVVIAAVVYAAGHILGVGEPTVAVVGLVAIAVALWYGAEERRLRSRAKAHGLNKSALIRFDRARNQEDDAMLESWRAEVTQRVLYLHHQWQMSLQGHVPPAAHYAAAHYASAPVPVYGPAR